MAKFLLRLLLWPAGLWRSLGADPTQLRALVGTKLTLDNRRPLAAVNSKKQRSARFAAVFGFIISVGLGIGYTIPLISFNDRLLGLVGYYTVFLFMLALALVTDFSNTLLDTRDSTILLPRPINSRTLLLARQLHIGIYLVRVVLPMALPGWVASVFLFGWKAAVWFPVPLLLLVLLALFLVNGIYFTILALAKPGRFKDVIGHFQIVLSVALFALFYLTPRLTDAAGAETLKATDVPWVQRLPGYWLGALWAPAGSVALIPGTGWLAVVAAVAPFLCLWLTVRFLAPQFIRRLGAADAVEARPAMLAAPVRVQKPTLATRLSRVLARDGAARAGFMLTWLQTARSRSFKLRVYPSVAFVPIYFIFLLTSGKRGIGDLWRTLPEGRTHLLLLYLTSFVLVQAVSYVVYSDQYKAAWIWRAVPLLRPGSAMGGSFKALWLKFFLPFFGITAGFVLVVWGAGAWLDVVLALVNVTFFGLLILRLAYRNLPFSLREALKGSAGKGFRVLATMFIPAILGGVHWLASPLPWLKVTLILLGCAALWTVWESHRETTFAQLERDTAAEA